MAQSTQYGAFVPTSFVWDISQLYETDLKDPNAVRELLVRLYQNLNLMANVLNVKDTGMYQITELVNGQLYFINPAYNSSTSVQPTLRQVFRKVINFGILPNTATISKPHGITITPTTTFTRIYGASSDPSTKFIPLPFVSATDVAHNIELNVDTTNVNVITGANYSAYTITYIVLEYLQT